jgi:hypothetical protein
MMGDADSSIERDNEEIRLRKLNPEQLASFLRNHHDIVWEYARVISDLRKRGYMVEDTGRQVKIWKEI